MNVLELNLALDERLRAQVRRRASLPAVTSRRRILRAAWPMSTNESRAGRTRSRGAASADRSGRARRAHRGQLKIFLGYASGVGKSFRLFDEGRRRRERGEDVVVAAIAARLPPDVGRGRRAALEMIPTQDDRRRAGHRRRRRCSQRRPRVCLIDGLAYDNPPGSRHPKRYEDVEELLEAGISVLTSINLEYIAEQQEFVRGVLGTAPAETVPQEFIDRADEVVVVDAPPEAERRHRARQRCRSFASGPCCSRPTSSIVSSRRTCGCTASSPSWGTQERILVCMTPRANAAADARQRPAQRRPLPRRAVRRSTSCSRT